ncbi:MAG: hypothetical protein ABIG89_06840 [Candidatus Woesearchaeota archaeon]
MTTILIVAVFGFIGGLARACVGYVKYRSADKKTKFKIQPFLITLLASGIIGTFAGLLVSTNYTLALLAGYAGTDLIENIYKIQRKTKTIFKK